MLLTWALGENEERVVNGFETWCWRIKLKIERTERNTKGKVFQWAKEEKLHLQRNKRFVILYIELTQFTELEYTVKFITSQNSSVKMIL